MQTILEELFGVETPEEADKRERYMSAIKAGDVTAAIMVLRDGNPLPPCELRCEPETCPYCRPH